MFDLSSVISQATEVAARQQEGGGGSRVRVIYPGTGTLKVKLLYNPKSNLVARQIRRHKVENVNHTCLSIYGVDCPICKAVSNVKNATGVDLWKYNAKTRGITYAQYVGSDHYKWDDSNKEPAVGELILLMYPWSVYQDINRLISSAGPQADKLIALNEGKVVNIIRWRESSQEKYKCEVDAFAPDFKSKSSEEEFEQFLNDLPDLNEAICPSQINAEIIKSAEGVAAAINRDYLSNSTYGGMPTSNSPQMSGNNNVIEINGQQYVLVNGQYVPLGGTPANNNPAPQVNNPPQNYTPPNNNPPQNVPPMGNSQDDVPFSMNDNPTPQQPVPTQQNNVPNGMPPCFGQHKDNDPKCLACINEIMCLTLQ